MRIEDDPARFLCNFLTRLDKEDFIHRSSFYQPEYLAVSLGWEVGLVVDLLSRLESEGRVVYRLFADGVRVRPSAPAKTVARRLPRWWDQRRPLLPRRLVGLRDFLHAHWTGVKCPACAGGRLGYEEICLVCGSRGVDELESKAQSRKATPRKPTRRRRVRTGRERSPR